MQNSKYGSCLKYCIISLIVFVGIFMPCVVRIPMQYIMLAVGIVYIVWSVIQLRQCKIYKSIMRMIISFVPFYLYYTILVIINIISGQYSVDVYLPDYFQALKIGFYVIIIATVLTLHHNKRGTNLDLVYRIIITVGVMQLLFVLLSFLSPSIKSFFNGLTFKNTYNNAIRSVMGTKYIMDWRGYGLAENTFDGFGFVISIISTITFIYGLNNDKKGVIILAWIMLIMPFLNARTGVVLCVVSYIYIMFKYLDLKRAIGFSVLIAAFFVAASILYSYLPVALQDAHASGLTGIIDLFKGKRTGVFSEILNADLIFPSDLILGAGASPERMLDIVGIDSGYVQCIWRFGIIGSILLYGGLISCVGIAYRSSKKDSQVLLITIVMVVAIYSFKLFLFMSYANMFTIFFLLFTIELGKEKWDENSLRMYESYNVYAKINRSGRSAK